MNNSSKDFSEQMKKIDSHIISMLNSEDYVMKKILHWIISNEDRHFVSKMLIAASNFGKKDIDVTECCAAAEVLDRVLAVHSDFFSNPFSIIESERVQEGTMRSAAVSAENYMISKALRYISSTGLSFSKEIGSLFMDICRRENESKVNLFNLDIDEDTYIDTFARKSADFFHMIFWMGAALSDADDEITDIMCDFGTNMGLLFQMHEDLADYDLKKICRPTYKNFAEGKYTLPVIAALDRPKMKIRLGSIARDIEENRTSNEQSGEIAKLVNEADGFKICYKYAYGYYDEASKLLAKLPLCDEREYLQQEIDRLLENCNQIIWNTRLPVDYSDFHDA